MRVLRVLVVVYVVVVSPVSYVMGELRGSYVY